MPGTQVLEPRLRISGEKASKWCHGRTKKSTSRRLRPRSRKREAVGRVGQIKLPTLRPRMRLGPTSLWVRPRMPAAGPARLAQLLRRRTMDSKRSKPVTPAAEIGDAAAAVTVNSVGVVDVENADVAKGNFVVPASVEVAVLSAGIERREAMGSSVAAVDAAEVARVAALVLDRLRCRMLRLRLAGGVWYVHPGHDAAVVCLGELPKRKKR